jgi:hypothetical protein
MSDTPDSQLFMSRVDALLEGEAAPISPLGAGIVVAIDMGIADSRSFSRLLAVEHALVLREIADLAGPDGLITVTGRHAKSLRMSLALSDRGALLLKDASPYASLKTQDDHRRSPRSADALQDISRGQDDEESFDRGQRV